MNFVFADHHVIKWNNTGQNQWHFSTTQNSFCCHDNCPSTRQYILCRRMLYYTKKEISQSVNTDVMYRRQYTVIIINDVSTYETY